MDGLELTERYNNLVATVNKLTKLTIGCAVAAFVTAMIMLFSANSLYLPLIILFFVPIYLIAYKNAKKETVAQINAIKSTDGLSERDKEIINKLEQGKILAFGLWGLPKK
jgi:cbb3-type cytochrome oxidase subunit 3